MNRVSVAELKQLRADMRAIAERAEREGREKNRTEEDLLNQLAAYREQLLGDIVFHAVCETHEEVIEFFKAGCQARDPYTFSGCA